MVDLALIHSTTSSFSSPPDHAEQTVSSAPTASKITSITRKASRALNHFGKSQQISKAAFDRSSSERVDVVFKPNEGASCDKTQSLFHAQFPQTPKEPELNISFGAIASPLCAIDERKTLTELKEWNQSFQNLFYNEQTHFFAFVELENGLRSFEEGYTTKTALGIFIQFLSLNLITNAFNDHQMDMARQLGNKYGKLKNVKNYLRSSSAQREYERMNPLGEALTQALSFYDRFQKLRTQINLPKNQVNILMQNLIKEQRNQLIGGPLSELASLEEILNQIKKLLQTV